MPRILKPLEYPESIADYAASWGALIGSRDPAEIRPTDGRHACDPPPRSSRVAIRAMEQYNPSEHGTDVEAYMASLPTHHRGDVLAGLAGEAAVTKDLTAAEIACVRAAAPEVLDVTDTEVFARAGIGRALFIRIAVSMGEADFTQLVMGLAHSEDVLTHFCDKAKTCKGGPGFPDLVLAGRHRTLFAELCLTWLARCRLMGSRRR